MKKVTLRLRSWLSDTLLLLGCSLFHFRVFSCASLGWLTCRRWVADKRIDCSLIQPLEYSREGSGCQRLITARLSGLRKSWNLAALILQYNSGRCMCGDDTFDHWVALFVGRLIFVTEGESEALADRLFEPGRVKTRGDMDRAIYRLHAEYLTSALHWSCRQNASADDSRRLLEHLNKGRATNSALDLVGSVCRLLIEYIARRGRFDLAKEVNALGLVSLRNACGRYRDGLHWLWGLISHRHCRLFCSWHTLPFRRVRILISVVYRRARSYALNFPQLILNLLQ